MWSENTLNKASMNNLISSGTKTNFVLKAFVFICEWSFPNQISISFENNWDSMWCRYEELRIVSNFKRSSKIILCAYQFIYYIQIHVYKRFVLFSTYRYWFAITFLQSSGLSFPIMQLYLKLISVYVFQTPSNMYVAFKDIVSKKNPCSV